MAGQVEGLAPMSATPSAEERRVAALEARRGELQRQLAERERAEEDRSEGDALEREVAELEARLAAMRAK